MLVMKFGGSSQSNAERIHNVCNIIQDYSKKEKLAVVLSAMGGVTDLLIDSALLAEKGEAKQVEKNLAEVKKRHTKAAKELIKDAKILKSFEAQLKQYLHELEQVFAGMLMLQEMSPRTLDRISGYGEILECCMVSHILKSRKQKAEFIDARELVKTDDMFGSAAVMFDLTDRNIDKALQPLIKKGIIPIITGFVGSTEKGITTTLGRSGSDYSASIFGAALKAKEIWIWTDVDGVMSADPRIVKDVFTWDKISYEEAAEMAYFGAKVIHPKTMVPAIAKNIPIRVVNTFEPQKKGTLISNQASESDMGVKVITTIRDITLINITGRGMSGLPGIASRVFATTARSKINVVTITQSSSEHSICFAVKRSDGDKALRALRAEFLQELNNGFLESIKKHDNVSIVAIVGEGMNGVPGISAKLFGALGKHGINVISIAQGVSEKNISVVVSEKDTQEAVKAIHSAFHLSNLRLNIVQFGRGVVGAKLIDQVKENQKRLNEELHVDVRYISVNSSAHSLYDEEGVDLKTWEKSLENASKKSIDQLIKDIQKDYHSNVIVVDATASEEVTKHYPNFLKAGFHLVTANKKYNAGTYKQYKDLKDIAKKHHKQFRYETNVGAGLPVINVIQDFVKTGDEIVSAQGVFSGTMGYIFSELEAGKDFSKIVVEAQKSGYTEPDPRDDLNGLDVARKLLIVAREQGQKMELKDIEIESLVSAKQAKMKSIDEYLNSLSDEDEKYKNLVASAKSQGKVLRYVGELNGTKAKVSIQAVDKSSPLGGLSGPDNMIVLKTRNYFHNPLVIQGPGAGPEVTANGVFTDVLRIGSYLH